MVKVKLVGERMMLAARVISALDRFDLALLLWAVRSWPRTRVLTELLKGSRMVTEIKKSTGMIEGSVYRALSDLRRAGLVDCSLYGLGKTRRRVLIYSITSTGLEPDGREV